MLNRLALKGTDKPQGGRQGKSLSELPRYELTSGAAGEAGESRVQGSSFSSLVPGPPECW